MKIESPIRWFVLMLALSWSCLPVMGGSATGREVAEAREVSETDSTDLTVLEPITGPDGEPIEGIAKPDEMVVLRSPIVATVDSIAVDEAQPVEVGQLLVQLDSALQEASVQRAKLEADRKAEIEHAQAALEEAEIVLKNTRQLWEAEAAAEFEFREAEFRHRQAQASRDGALEGKAIAEAVLEQEMRRLDQYEIRAPFSGFVIHIEARLGSTVSEEQSIIAIARLDPLRAEMHLPAVWYNRLRVGDRYIFRAEPPVDARLVGHCQMIEPMIDSASGTFRCVFTIHNPNARLPGGFKVRLLGPAEDLAEVSDESSPQCTTDAAK